MELWIKAAYNILWYIILWGTFYVVRLSIWSDNRGGMIGIHVDDIGDGVCAYRWRLYTSG